MLSCQSAVFLIMDCGVWLQKQFQSLTVGIQNFVVAESKRELCQVPGVPFDQDAGAHLQDLGQHARRGEMPQQSPIETPMPPVPSSGQPPIHCCPFLPLPLPLPLPLFRLHRHSAQPTSPDYCYYCIFMHVLALKLTVSTACLMHIICASHKCWCLLDVQYLLSGHYTCLACDLI